MRLPPFEIDGVGHGGQAKDAGAGGEEMSSIVIRVESDEIAVQYTKKNFLSDGEDAIVRISAGRGWTRHVCSPVDFATGEGGV